MSSPVVDTWYFSVAWPSNLVRDSPALASAECITYVAFIFSLLHALSSRSRSRSRSSLSTSKKNVNKNDDRLMLLTITLLGASIVDPFCLVSEQIRNYYHDRASVLMFGKHVAPWQFPLFANLAYLGGASARRVFERSGARDEKGKTVQMWWFAEASLASIINSFTFYSFDMIACKYLIYQWHDQDPLYADRTGECVPCASSMWVVAYGFIGSLLARYSHHQHAVNGRPWTECAAAATLVFIPAHILPISLLYVPYIVLFRSGAGAVRFSLALCALTVITYFTLAKPRVPSPSAVNLKNRQSMLLFAAIAAWFGGLAFHGWFLPPENVVSTCIHQPYHETSEMCSAQETYLFGFAQRKRFMCASDFRFWELVPPAPEPGTDWYTIKGLPADKSWYKEYFGTLVVGVVLHTCAFFAPCWNFGKKKAR